LTELPELFDLRIKARALAFLFVAGAALAGLTLILPHDQGFRDAQLSIVIGCAVVIGALLYWGAHRIAEWQLHLALGAGTTLIAFANYYSTATLYALLFTWAALYAFYFFGTAAALAHLGYIGVAYGVELAVVDAPSPEIRWLLGVGTPLVAGMLVVRMLDRLRAGRAEADERARELRESEARTRLVLDSAPDAFLTSSAGRRRRQSVSRCARCSRRPSSAIATTNGDSGSWTASAARCPRTTRSSWCAATAIASRPRRRCRRWTSAARSCWPASSAT
jgi:PAS domain-containing protein